MCFKEKNSLIVFLAAIPRNSVSCTSVVVKNSFLAYLETSASADEFDFRNTFLKFKACKLQPKTRDAGTASKGEKLQRLLWGHRYGCFYTQAYGAGKSDCNILVAFYYVFQQRNLC